VTPEDWKRIKDVLAEALEKDPSERPTYLDKNCPDPESRKEVESLISAYETGDANFLEQSDFERGTLAAGVIVGSYEILGHLGSGGMGDVYRAYDSKLGREVAIKVLRRNLAHDPTFLQRFQREAHVLASLNHPNIVTVYDVGRDESTGYIAMELVDGKALDEVLAAGPLPLRDVLDVAAQAGAGLAAAHSSRIVHRDLKPKNVMIRKDGLVKILDFGLSKLTPPTALDSDRAAAVTTPGILLGTIDYMSPEQAGSLPADFHSDQFSLGVLIYEMATGQRPFNRRTGPETLVAIMEDEAEPVASLNPGVPAALETIIRRCLAKKPESRYESTEELALSLKELRDSADSQRVRSRSAGARIFLHGLPRRVQAAIASGLVVLAVGVAAPRLAEKIHSWSRSVSPKAEKQLVVLPFTNVGSDPENQSFCDGLVEILTGKLSQSEQFQRAFRVVPSIDVLREGIVSVREARQTFGADLAITGSVQRTGDRIRLTINLVDPQALLQVKSKTIDTEAQGILEFQDGVVLQVSELLNVNLSSQAKQMLAGGSTTAPSAYEFYTQGRGYLQRYEAPQNIEAAISLFKLALEKDPRYALAEAALGEAYWRKYMQTHDPQWAEEAGKTSAAAIKLNDKLAQVYVTLGMIQEGTGHYSEASQNLQKALQIDPANSDAYRELAKTYETAGRLKEAEATYFNAISLRPGSWATYNELGGFYYRLGRYDDAKQEFQKVVELTPDNARGYSNLGVIAYSQNQYEQAAKMYEKSLAIKPSDAAYSNLGLVYYSLGNYAEAARYNEQAVQMNERNSGYWHDLAAAYQWSGDLQKARAAFQRTAELTEQERRVNPHDSTLLIQLADAYSMLNQARRARELLRQALKLAPDDSSELFQVSVVYEQLGDRKLALEWIAKAIKGGYSRDLIDKSPTLAQLRRDSRFEELLGP
jgi:serine/threonine-protein kinase